MSYRTILVHLSDERRAERLIGTALGVATGKPCHIVGMAVLPPVYIMPAGVPGAADPVIIDDHRVAYADEAKRIEQIFTRTTTAQGVVAEWRLADGERSSVAERLLQHARTADLVVASQVDPEWYGSEYHDVGERLAMESGRPVLLVPNHGQAGGQPRRAVVAWNGRREAARAAFDALPLLMAAAQVRVVWINPQDEAEVAQDVPAADLCMALARHGVKAEAAEVVRPGADAGQVLADYVGDWRADLVVMGCYGHSRLRELVLGGATRHMLKSMPVPVLLSH